MTRAGPAALAAVLVAVSVAVAPSCARLACHDPYAWVEGACVLRDPWPAACPASADAELDQTGLLFIGPVAVCGAWGLDETPIGSQEALDALLADTMPTPEMREVDFDTEVVIGAYVQIGTTCGVTLGNHGLTDATTLVVQVEDDSGTCARQCDMDYAMAVLYAIARPATAFTVCTEVVASCE